jgi:hypothetical protein
MKKAATWVILLSAGMWSACETVVELDLPEYKPELVANCFFNPDSLIEIMVSSSAGSLDNVHKIGAVNTAVVEIYENGQLRETLPNVKDNGLYRSTFKPLAGKLYQLKAKSTGFEEIDAFNTIPSAVEVTSFTYKDSASFDQYGSYQAELTLHFFDPPIEMNYYSVEVFTYDTIYLNYPPGVGDTTFLQRSLYLNSDDPGAVDFTYGGQKFFNGEFMDGKNYALKLLLNSYETIPGAPITLTFHQISKEMFLYLKTFSSQMQNKGNPFSEPVVVFNNVHHGLGIFAGYNAQTIKVR